VEVEYLRQIDSGMTTTYRSEEETDMMSMMNNIK
jgi:hypothetical protein